MKCIQFYYLHCIRAFINVISYKSRSRSCPLSVLFLLLLCVHVFLSRWECACICSCVLAWICVHAVFALPLALILIFFFLLFLHERRQLFNLTCSMYIHTYTSVCIKTCLSFSQQLCNSTILSIQIKSLRWRFKIKISRLHSTACSARDAKCVDIQKYTHLLMCILYRHMHGMHIYWKIADTRSRNN